MSNTSATGGYLAPGVAPAPLEDEAFEDFLQQVISQISGVAGELTRPRWNLDPANLPSRDVTWMAFGIMRQSADTYGAIRHSDTGEGYDELQRNETVEVLISSYGPEAVKVLSRFRDGLLIEQNREALWLAKVGQADTGDIIPAPSLVKERWLRRYDMTWTFRRLILRSYPVLNLVSAVGVISNEKFETPLVIEQTTP